MKLILAFLALVVTAAGGIVLAAQQDEETFVGGITENRAQAAQTPIPVRNDMAQPGEEIVTLRHFRIQKGTFDEFYEASVTGVWPYFEKLGARVIGMWQEIHPETDMGAAGEASAEYDDVWLMTRYASVAHWRATRDMALHGGNGPDWVKAREALALRRRLTTDTSVRFLQGHKWDNAPWFMPGLGEQYELVDPAQ